MHTALGHGWNGVHPILGAMMAYDGRSSPIGAVSIPGTMVTAALLAAAVMIVLGIRTLSR